MITLPITTDDHERVTFNDGDWGTNHHNPTTNTGFTYITKADNPIEYRIHPNMGHLAKELPGGERTLAEAAIILDAIIHTNIPDNEEVKIPTEVIYYLPTYKLVNTDKPLTAYDVRNICNRLLAAYTEPVGFPKNTPATEIVITAHDANRIQLYNLDSRSPLNDHNVHHDNDLGFTITDGDTQHVYTLKPGVDTNKFFFTPGEDRVYALAALAAYKAEANGLQEAFTIIAAEDTVAPSVAGFTQKYVTGLNPQEVLKRLSTMWRITTNPAEIEIDSQEVKEANPIIGYGIMSYQKPLNDAKIGADGFYIRQNDKETVDMLAQWFSTMAQEYYQCNPDFGTQLAITYGDTEERIKQRFEDYQAFSSEMAFSTPNFLVCDCDTITDELASLKRRHEETPVTEREKNGYDPLYELY